MKLFTTVAGYVRVPVKVKAKKEENKKLKKSYASDATNELSEPRWSVVSFESCAANNLTYDQATRKLTELAARKVSGLCIITDEAAARIDKK